MVTSLNDISPRFASSVLVVAVIILVAFNLPHLDAFFSQDDFAGLFVDADNASEFAEFFKPEPTGVRPWYRPVSFQLRYWVMRELFGFDPVPFHLLSLLIHSVNIFLCYRFLRLLTDRRDLSTLAAVLYGLNGAHQMALFWFSAGNEIFAAFFFLWGMNVFLDWKLKPGMGRGIGVCLLFILMLLCKETAVTFPFVILLTNYLISRDTESRFGANKSGGKIIIALFMILVIYLAFWFLFQYQPGGGEGEGYSLTLNPVKLGTNFVAFVVQAFIGRGIIYAVTQSAVGGYPSDIARGMLHSPMGMTVVGVICLLITGFIILLRRVWKDFPKWTRCIILWGLAWFVICLFPVLPLAGHNYAYYMNLALIGFSAMLASIAYGFRIALPPSSSWRKIGWILVGLFIVNFVANTWISANVRTIPRLSVIAEQAFDEMLRTRTSFEEGTVLFILDVDNRFDWAVQHGLMYRAYYGDDLSYCYVILEGQKAIWSQLEARGWSDERPKVFYSWDGSDYIPRDEQYFLERYLSEDSTASEPRP